jgi:two-component system cell cycle response regulator
MKILIAEDDPVSRRVLEANLVEWGYDVMIASDGSEAWELLQKPDAPNLVISDWMMPHMDGLELCRRIRQMERSGYIYFIILTAKGRKEDIIEGLEAGADDFLIKPFDRQELKYRAKIGERIINLELRILELANTDALTGVLNRRAFMERMEQEIHRSLREGVPFSLILTDIDYFKKVNDRHGHQVGDLVLQRFTERLSESSRPYDFVGRYGGEEFVVCLPGADISQAGSVAERMRRRVEEMRITLPDSQQSIRITGSFGVASFRAGSEETVDLITGRADDTMYRAKREGRNRVCVASEAGH